MNTKAKVHMYLYRDGESVPAWDGKQLARLRTYIATNGIIGQLRIKAVNLQDGSSEELTVSRFDGNLYQKIEHLHAYVAGTAAQ